ncbi:Protein PHLOEM UNLOADING MODULATOR [Linum perenne]
MTVDIGSELFGDREHTSSAPLSTGLSKVEDAQKGATPIDSPCSVPGRWDEIVVEPRSSLPSSNKGAEKTAASGIMVMNTIDPGTSRNRQCITFIQSKGRQCVRWANEGDVYYCVHLASRFTGSSAKAEETKQTIELDNGSSDKTTSNNPNGVRKFICRFCGLKFDLLPDLGRHHQAAHMGPNMLNSRPQKKTIGYYAYRSNSGRLTRPRFKKESTYANASLKKRIQATKLLSYMDLNVQPRVSDPSALGRWEESQCSAIAKILFSEIQKTKPRPNNPEILATARSVCCRVSLKASLEGKYGLLAERFYLCSEHNIQVEWHHEGDMPPLPNTGQWFLLWLNENLPEPMVEILGARIVGMHHYLMLFIMLGFSVLFGSVQAPGFGMGARYIFSMAIGRILRIITFVSTILPSARPWCDAGRFQVPTYPHPWAQKYYVPYASVLMMYARYCN